MVTTWNIVQERNISRMNSDENHLMGNHLYFLFSKYV